MFSCIYTYYTICTLYTRGSVMSRQSNATSLLPTLRRHFGKFPGLFVRLLLIIKFFRERTPCLAGKEPPNVRVRNPAVMPRQTDKQTDKQTDRQSQLYFPTALKVLRLYCNVLHVYYLRFHEHVHVCYHARFFSRVRFFLMMVQQSRNM